MKIIHLADLHIRILKHHVNYRTILKELYLKLLNIKPDIIVFCGDLFQNKATLSPEAIGLASEFLRYLSGIAPLYLILGNHDLVLRNLTRLDSLSPIVMALNEPRIHFLKESQEVDLGNDFVLNVLSIYDKFSDFTNWPSNPNKINIALYHGPIVGAITDIGWIVDKGDMSLDLLSKFDFALLGDLHKSNQTLDSEGKARYCGSLIQQNFAEEGEHGFLVWNIKDKNDFTCDFIPLENPSLFITIKVVDGSIVFPKFEIPRNSHIRLMFDTNIPFDKMKNFVDIMKTRHNAESVICICKPIESVTTQEINVEISNDNLRDVSVQEKLIENHLKEYKIETNVLNSVFDLNKKYKTLIEKDEDEISRNVHWKVKSFRWDNLFNYGEQNKIDFSLLEGVVGIFGKSYAGKSSVYESLLYTIFNSISKNSRKNYNIINQNEKFAKGWVEIETDDGVYTIQRSSEKYDKKGKNNITEEAKTIVNFGFTNKNGKFENLDGFERSDTDKNIRKIFGSIDDFLLTSLASQFGFLTFINEGSTKRKEILAKFLDLEMFEKKFKFAKEDAAESKSSLKRLENIVKEEEILKIENEILTHKNFLTKQKQLCEELKIECLDIQNEIDTFTKKIISVPTKVLNIQEIERNILTKENIISDSKKQQKSHNIEIDKNEKTKERLETFLIKSFDIDYYLLLSEEIKNKTKTLDELKKSLSINKKNCLVCEKKIELLKEVPCGSDYKNCKFIKDAYESQELLEKDLQEIEKINQDIEKVTQEIESIEPIKVKEYIEKYNRLKIKKQEFMNIFSDLSIKLHKNETLLLKETQELEKLQQDKKEYENNKDSIENFASLVESKEKKIKEKEEKEILLTNCEKEILKLYKKHGSLEQQLNDLKSKQEELQKLRIEYSAYDLYLQCMHSDGIAYDIIKQKLPIINNEISKILTNVVNFNVFFENDGNKLNINIKHPSYEPRPLELGSGAEKTIASLAIRLALIKICNLPMPNFIVLDEPSLACDEMVTEGFTRMLETLKEHFQFIILISHIDSLKDCCDSEIVINHAKGRACIVQ